MSSLKTQTEPPVAGEPGAGKTTRRLTPALSVSKEGLFWTTWRLLRKSPVGMVGLAMALILVAVAIFAPLLARYDPIALDMAHKLLPPSSQYWFGTDELGRDVYSRIIYGSRISVEVGAIVILIGSTLGIAIGSVAGYVGGRTDEIIMRVTDMFLAFPSLILAIAVATVLGPGMTNAMIAIAATWWPWYARLVRGQVLSVKQHEYVEAARAAGAGHLRVLFRYILPNCVAPIIVQVTMDLGYAILTTASLSFIGLGAQPPTPEWGSMISAGRTYLMNYWWYPTFPGIAIFFSVLGFNLLGDALRDIFDPRARRMA